MKQPRLVALPALSSSEDMLRPLAEALGDPLPLTPVEPPGFGDAPAPQGVPSTRQLARAVLDAWPSGDASQTVLFGVSLGSMVAQWIALDASERIAALVLASSAACGLGVLRHDPLRQLARARCLLKPDAEALACLAESVLNDTASEPAVHLATRSGRRHPRARRDLVWLAAAAGAHDTRDRLPGLTLPTLVVTGGSDALLAPAQQAELARALPNAEWVQIPGVGHDLTLEAPAELARVILSFVGRRLGPDVS